jgi:hypothetical protein
MVWRDKSANQTLDPMTRSAVSRIFQVRRHWRTPRHRSAFRSADAHAVDRTPDPG